MAKITEGKYKGLTQERKEEIAGQGGTLVGAPIIRSSESAFSLNAPDIYWEGYKIGETSITYTGDLIELLNDGNIGTGTNVTVDESYNTINADGTQYTLSIDENGVLRIKGYDALIVQNKTPDYTDTLEYGQTNITGGLTSVSVTCNKAFTGSFSSSDVNVTNNNISGFTLSASTNYTVNYNDTTTKIINTTLTEVENTSHTIPVTITIKKPSVKYKYAYIISDNEIDLNTININNWTKSVLCDGYPSTSNKISVNISGSDKYVYVMFLDAQNFNINDNTFVYQSTMSFSGGMIDTEKTFNYYTNKTYKIWRTTNKLIGSWNIVFKK